MKMKILFYKDFWPPCGKKKKNKKVGGVQLMHFFTTENYTPFS